MKHFFMICGILLSGTAMADCGLTGMIQKRISECNLTRSDAAGREWQLVGNVEDKNYQVWFNSSSNQLWTPSELSDQDSAISTCNDSNNPILLGITALWRVGSTDQYRYAVKGDAFKYVFRHEWSPGWYWTDKPRVGFDAMTNSNFPNDPMNALEFSCVAQLGL